MKYLLVTVAITTLAIVLTTFGIMSIKGYSGSGYAIGLSVDPVALLVLGLQLLCSVVIAYLIGPSTINAIVKGQYWAYAGIKSLFICWTLPWIIFSVIASRSALTSYTIVLIVVVSMMPSLMVGPIFWLALKRKLRM